MTKFKLLKKSVSFILVATSIFFYLNTHSYSSEKNKLLNVDWSFKGLTGKFDRASLQRGYQVYKEVCSSCHSMQYLSYRNLGEKGGPIFYRRGQSYRSKHRN